MKHKNVNFKYVLIELTTFLVESTFIMNANAGIPFSGEEDYSI